MYNFFNRATNLLITLIPISMIIGNTVTNSLIILICILGLINYKTSIFNTEKNNYIFFIFIYVFFFYLIFITTVNNYNKLDLQNPLYKEHILKSIFYLRFLILFLVINKICETKNFNYKLFFIVSFIASLVVALDVIFQFIFEKNITGKVIVLNRPSSFFGSENIAGSWLQKYSLFSIFLFTYYKKTNKDIISLLFFSIFSIAILLSANRMACLIYFSSIMLFYIFEKKFKILIFFILFTFFSLGFVIKILPNTHYLNNTVLGFFHYSKRIITMAPNLFYNNKVGDQTFIEFGGSGYLITFNSGVQLWKKNKIFGSGLKSFRLNCKYGNNQTCNTHPHNYTIEIMLEMGLLGLFLIYSIFFISFKNYFRNCFFTKNNTLKVYSLPFFLILFFEIFPIRSTGSFFTTSNSVVIFLFLSIFINSIHQKNYK